MARKTPPSAIGLVLALALAVVVFYGTGAAEAATTYRLGEGVHSQAGTLGPDGDLWFAGYGGYSEKHHESTGNVIGTVTPAGKVVEYRTGLDSLGKGIAVGGDGALWATSDPEGDKDQIVRATTAGELSFFPLSDPEAGPGPIVAGPDGALWFTEGAADSIGRITTAGTITEVPLPPGSKPSDIVLGADGDLWVSAAGTDSIDRVTTSGEVAAFPIGGGHRNHPGDLTLGRDGKVWFTQYPSPRIGRISPRGKISEFRLPVPATAISPGPRGDIWFAYFPKLKGGSAFDPSKGIASITPHGHLTRPVCPLNCRLEPEWLLPAPGGGLWFGTGVEFTEGGGGSGLFAATQAGFVGRFRPAPPRSKVGP